MSNDESDPWQPIETLDKREMAYVLVKQSGAVRAHLWNPHKNCWERPYPIGSVVAPSDECGEPTHWCKIP